MGSLPSCQRENPDRSPPEAESSSKKEPGTEQAESSPNQANQRHQAQYEQPTNAGAAPRQPVGHAVALVGYEVTPDGTRKALVNDPANNLVNGQGQHKWSAKPDGIAVSLRDDAVRLAIAGRKARIVGAIVMRPAGERDADAGQGAPERVLLESVPDFSQHAKPDWQNMCGPTVAADLLYWWDQRHGSVLRERSRGPGPAANRAVNQLIAASGGDEPSDLSLAARMNGDAGGGTTPAAIAEGVRGHLEANGQNWSGSVRFLDTSEMGRTGRAQWQYLKRRLAGQNGLILCLHWVGGQPPNNGRPMPRDAASAEAGDGHTSNDNDDGDSDNNANANGDEARASAANQSGQSDADSPSSQQADASSTNQNGGPRGGPGSTNGHRQSDTGSTDQDTPLPPPTSSRQTDTRDDPFDETPEGVLPSAPKRKELPAIDQLVANPDANGGEEKLNQLTGRWRQVEGGKGADFAEGGYAQSTMTFKRDGTVLIERKFGNPPALTLTRRLQWRITEASQLRLMTPADEAGPDFLEKPLKLPVEGHGQAVTVTPARLNLPATLPMSLNNNRLQLGGKKYLPG
jgi:hypothetical protein